jgi:hypothetical protein
MFSVQEHKQRFNIQIFYYTTNYGLCEFDITDIMHEHIELSLVRKGERLENLLN